MNLFRLGQFTLHSGKLADWKIDCDALTIRDWAALAVMAVEILPPFGAVYGIPRGGIFFANALIPHITLGEPILIADDVFTTGESMEGAKEWVKNTYSKEATVLGILGIVAFSRGSTPAWVRSIFTKSEKQ